VPKYTKLKIDKVNIDVEKKHQKIDKVNIDVEKKHHK